MKVYTARGLSLDFGVVFTDGRPDGTHSNAFLASLQYTIFSIVDQFCFIDSENTASRSEIILLVSSVVNIWLCYYHEVCGQ